jgi:4-aminobutyrate aminotransferase-like enzyme
MRAAGVVCIADEVQTGFGRCGAMWAFQLQGVVPDAVTLGKPMGALRGGARAAGREHTYRSGHAALQQPCQRAAGACAKAPVHRGSHVTPPRRPPHPATPPRAPHTGNGFPISALVTTRTLAAAFAAGGMEYFNTFGGCHAAVAAARAVLRELRERRLQDAAADTGRCVGRGVRATAAAWLCCAGAWCDTMVAAGPAPTPLHTHLPPPVPPPPHTHASGT